MFECVVTHRRRAEPVHEAVAGAAREDLHHAMDLLAVTGFPVGHPVVVAVVRTCDRRIVGTDDEHDLIRIGVGHLLHRVLVPVADAVVFEAARNLVVDRRVDDAGRAAGLAERGPERSCERVAADPQLQRFVVTDRARRAELVDANDGGIGRRYGGVGRRLAFGGRGVGLVVVPQRHRGADAERDQRDGNDRADDSGAALSRREPSATAVGAGGVLVSHRGIDES